MERKRIFEVRKANLWKLCLDRFHGNRAALSRASKVNPNHINLLLSSNEEFMRNLGEELARRIERELGLPSGWFDTPKDGTQSTQPIVVNSMAADDAISHLFQEATEIQSVSFGADYFSSKGIRITGAENLILMRLIADDLEPRIKSGEHVIIDTGIKAVTIDGMYVLRKDDYVFVRRCERDINGSIVAVTSTGKAEIGAIGVIGKIVCVISTTRT